LAAKKSVKSCDGEIPADPENKKTRQRVSKLINVIIDKEEICPLDKTVKGEWCFCNANGTCHGF
jgi:hypothetical protein